MTNRGRTTRNRSSSSADTTAQEDTIGGHEAKGAGGSSTKRPAGDAEEEARRYTRASRPVPAGSWISRAVYRRLNKPNKRRDRDRVHLLGPILSCAINLAVYELARSPERDPWVFGQVVSVDSPMAIRAGFPRIRGSRRADRSNVSLASFASPCSITGSRVKAKKNVYFNTLLLQRKIINLEIAQNWEKINQVLKCRHFFYEEKLRNKMYAQKKFAFWGWNWKNTFQAHRNFSSMISLSDISVLRTKLITNPLSRSDHSAGLYERSTFLSIIVIPYRLIFGHFEPRSRVGRFEGNDRDDEARVR